MKRTSCCGSAIEICNTHLVLLANRWVLAVRRHLVVLWVPLVRSHQYLPSAQWVPLHQADHVHQVIMMVQWAPLVLQVRFLLALQAHLVGQSVLMVLFKTEINNDCHKS